MKKINILAGMLMGVVMLGSLASCDDDRDNNPVLDSRTAPTTFPLNTPALASSVVDLATSSTLSFSWSQPAYGFPAAVEYQMQISADNVWTASVADSIADETLSTSATYATVGSPTGSVTTSVSASEIATSLEQIKHWSEDAVPATTTVYARCAATYAGTTIYSNVVTFIVVPYYVELKAADPIIYYLTGGCIGDGSWGNATDQIGTAMVPLLPVPGTTFDTTGAGQIEWYGYLPDNAEFKIIVTPGDWDHGICGDGGTEGGTSIRNGGDDPGNISVAEGGYYHILITTNTDITKTTTVIEKYDQTPTVFTSMAFPGTQNGWDTTVLLTGLETAANNSAYCHDWTTDITFDSDATGDEGTKFAANGAWDTNWGATDFPYGTGTNGGPNIPYKAGTYKVFFNDISGTYYFFAQ